MAAVVLELSAADGQSRAVTSGLQPRHWIEYVASGETLGRLLTRITSEYPEVHRAFESNSRRLANGARISVNGRDAHLIGGFTYILDDRDVVSIILP